MLAPEIVTKIFSHLSLNHLNALMVPSEYLGSVNDVIRDKTKKALYSLGFLDEIGSLMDSINHVKLGVLWKERFVDWERVLLVETMAAAMHRKPCRSHSLKSLEKYFKLLTAFEATDVEWSVFCRNFTFPKVEEDNIFVQLPLETRKFIMTQGLSPNGRGDLLTKHLRARFARIDEVWFDEPCPWHKVHNVVCPYSKNGDFSEKTAMEMLMNHDYTWIDDEKIMVTFWPKMTKCQRWILVRMIFNFYCPNIYDGRSRHHPRLWMDWLKMGISNSQLTALLWSLEPCTKVELNVLLQKFDRNTLRRLLWGKRLPNFKIGQHFWKLLTSNLDRTKDLLAEVKEVKSMGFDYQMYMQPQQLADLILKHAKKDLPGLKEFCHWLKPEVEDVTSRVVQGMAEALDRCIDELNVVEVEKWLDCMIDGFIRELVVTSFLTRHNVTLEFCSEYLKTTRKVNDYNKICILYKKFLASGTDLKEFGRLLEQLEREGMPSDNCYLALCMTFNKIMSLEELELHDWNTVGDKIGKVELNNWIVTMSVGIIDWNHVCQLIFMDEIYLGKFSFTPRILCQVVKSWKDLNVLMKKWLKLDVGKEKEELKKKFMTIIFFKFVKDHDWPKAGEVIDFVET